MREKDAVINLYKTKNIETIIDSKIEEIQNNISIVSVVNDVITGGTSKALSAEQGKVINEQLSDIPNQTYITEKAKTVDVNNALVLKANQADLVATSAKVTTNTTQIASLASGSPKGTYATVSALTTTFPTGNTNIYVVTGNVKEVDTLTVTAIPAIAGNITITLNGVAKTVALDLTMTTTTLVATTIRGTTFSGWTTGGSGAVVTFTKSSSGTNTTPVFTDTGVTGSTATFTVTTAGVNADGCWYYWNINSWTSGGVYQSQLVANSSVGLGQLNDSLKDTSRNIISNEASAFKQGRFLSGGLSVDANTIYSESFTLSLNTAYYFSCASNLGLDVCLYTFDASGTRLQYITLASGTTVTITNTSTVSARFGAINNSGVLTPESFVALKPLIYLCLNTDSHEYVDKYNLKIALQDNSVTEKKIADSSVSLFKTSLWEESYNIADTYSTSYVQGTYGSSGYNNVSYIVSSGKKTLDVDCPYFFNLKSSLSISNVYISVYNSSDTRLGLITLSTSDIVDYTLTISSTTYPTYSYIRIGIVVATDVVLTPIILGNSDTKIYLAKTTYGKKYIPRYIVKKDLITTQETYTVNIVDMGAVGDGVTDNKTVFQKALNLAYNYRSIEIRVPNGDYYIGQLLRYYPNTRIVMESNARLIRPQGTGGMFTDVFNVTPITPCYSLGYFEIIGGTSICNYTPDFVSSREVYIQAGRLSRLTVKDHTMIDCCCANHLIDISGSNNVLIEGCTIQGMHLPPSLRPTDPYGDTTVIANLEMLQIDRGNGLGSSGDGDYSFYPTKNVTIRNNVFKKNESNVYSVVYRPIGIHANVLEPVTYLFFENISIEGNEFYDVLGRVIGLSKTKNVAIKNNRFYNTTGLIDHVIKFTLYMENWNAITYNTEISGNTVSYTGADNGYKFLSMVASTVSANTRMKNTKICNNICPSLGIDLNLCDNVLLYFNNFSSINQDVGSTKVINLESLT